MPRSPARTYSPGGALAATRVWLIERRVVFATGFAASLPILFSVAHNLAIHWTPLGDNAIIGIRALDVFSAHPPLVGQSSSGASGVVTQHAYSPGPMLFWLFAIPVRFFGSISLIVTQGLVNVACVIGVISLARRRAGTFFMFVVAIALAIMLASLPGEAYSDIWNSSAPLLPFTLLLFASWSLAWGRHRLLPLTVLLASFVAQCHLAYVVPAAAVSALGIAAFLIRRRADRDDRSQPPIKRWVLAATLIGVVSWIPPIVDQVIHSPGNFRLLTSAASTGDRTLGASAGWHAVVHLVGVRPWWLQGPPSALARIADLAEAPSALSTATAALILAALALTMLMCLRRRQLQIALAMAMALALCVGVGIDAASTPSRSFATVYYTLRWASPAGMFVWLMLGWGVASFRWSERRAPAFLRPASRIAAGLVLSFAAGALVAADSHPAPDNFAQMRNIGAQVNARLRPDSSIRVDGHGDIFQAAAFQAGLVLSLRREGRRVIAPSIAKKISTWYADGSYDQLVSVNVSLANSRQGGQVIGRALLGKMSGARERVQVILGQTAARPPCIIDEARTSGGIGCRPAVAAGANFRLTQHAIVRSDGRRFPLVPGRIEGYVEGSVAVGRRLRIRGWAASPLENQAADAVLVFAGSVFVGAVKPTTPRPDVMAKYHRAVLTSGFNVELTAPRGRATDLRFFGLAHGFASRLSVGCASHPAQVGC